jgi:hypothetical protein
MQAVGECLEHHDKSGDECLLRVKHYGWHLAPSGLAWHPEDQERTARFPPAETLA